MNEFFVFKSAVHFLLNASKIDTCILFVQFQMV